MYYTAEDARRYNRIPILTFNQLAEPNESSFKNMVLKLGPFQLINSLGCIGTTMNNSGLSDIVETIYGSTTIELMMSVKAISRAIQCHIIVDLLLDGMLLSKAFKMPFLEETETEEVEL